MSSRIGGIMRLFLRWVTLAGATCACLAAFAGTAAASQHLDRLLHRYQPVTVLDSHEAFAPTSVASFAADADLETQTAPNTWVVVTASPSLGPLPAARRVRGGRRPSSTGTSTTTTSTATATRRMTSSGRRTRATGRR